MPVLVAQKSNDMLQGGLNLIDNGTTKKGVVLPEYVGSSEENFIFRFQKSNPQDWYDVHIAKVVGDGLAFQGIFEVKGGKHIVLRSETSKGLLAKGIPRIHSFEFDVMGNEKPLGFTEVIPLYRNNQWDIVHSEIKSTHRRLGIGTLVYDKIEVAAATEADVNISVRGMRVNRMASFLKSRGYGRVGEDDDLEFQKNVPKSEGDEDIRSFHKFTVKVGGGKKTITEKIKVNQLDF